MAWTDEYDDSDDGVWHEVRSVWMFADGRIRPRDCYVDGVPPASLYGSRGTSAPTRIGGDARRRDNADVYSAAYDNLDVSG